MKVLVTGGTGFTGKALVRRMLDEGHEVVALDYQEGHKTSELRDWGAEVVLGSITDPSVVERCMRGVDVVHHVAATFREIAASLSHYRNVNVEGTRLLLDAAHRHGVRKFVHCSTCGVHGHVEHPPADENAPIKPADYYQQSKSDAEPLVQQYVERGLKATILRPAAIFGPGDLGRFRLIFKQLSRGWFPMFGDGKVLYHTLYIDNFLDAFVLAMQELAGIGEPYLVADAECVSIEDLVRRAAAVMGRKPKFLRLPLWPVVGGGHLVEALCKPFGIDPPLHPRRVEFYQLTRAFSISKARRELGYEPKVGLDEGLRRAYDWYKREGLIA